MDNKPREFNPPKGQFPLRTRRLNDSLSGVEVLGLDLNSAGEEELLALGKLIAEELLVVLCAQRLTPEREVEVCATIGSVEMCPDEILHRCPRKADGEFVRGIQRVTGLKHPDGKPMGLFGHDSDLDWHANRPSAEKERKPFIWLYSDFGSVGSRTSWANCSAAYEDLDDETKHEIQDLLGIYGFERGRYTETLDFNPHLNLNGIPFVQKNAFTGRSGIYFPFLQLFGFKDRPQEYSDRLIRRLKDHVLQPKYIYHHDWRDGDVVVSEQWLTIHKRWACDVSNRMLHRISFDYDRVRSRFSSGNSFSK